MNLSSHELRKWATEPWQNGMCQGRGEGQRGSAALALVFHGCTSRVWALPALRVLEEERSKHRVHAGLPKAKPCVTSVEHGAGKHDGEHQRHDAICRKRTFPTKTPAKYPGGETSRHLQPPAGVGGRCSHHQNPARSSRCFVHPVSSCFP